MSILWSTHAYYNQFVPVVQQQISKLRNPIEKLLKVQCNVPLDSVAGECPVGVGNVGGFVLFQ